jgi:chaperonin cofactor prefoldin
MQQQQIPVDRQYLLNVIAQKENQIADLIMQINSAHQTIAELQKKNESPNPIPGEYGKP